MKNTNLITEIEFHQRRANVLKHAEKEQLDAVLIWSRGGNTVEAYGDVFYLSNFHSLFPVVADRSGWSGRGHAALILSSNFEPILITDFLDDPGDQITISDVRVTSNLAASTGETLKSLGLCGKRIGLVGGSSFLSSAEREMRLVPGCSNLNLIPCDHILEFLRSIKSQDELQLMRHAGQVGSAWMNTTMSALIEGATEGEAVGEGLRFLASHGGIQQDIAISSGPNSMHYFGNSGVPHWNCTRKLIKGDLVHCDQWGPINAYYSDFARSTVIGFDPSDDQRVILEGSISLVEHIISMTKPGITLGQLYDCGRDWLAINGFSGSEDNFSTQYPCFGHHVGLGIDGPWIAEGETSIVTPNMVLAIEAIVSKPDIGASNFEQNIIIHDNSIELITNDCKKRWWN